jgi:arylsulfatase A-like enzyme
MILAAGAVVAVLAVPAFEFAPGTAAAERPAKRPNVVFFLADDHTWQAISCYGSKLGATPNIDRIAAAGVRFDRCFCTESICGPSRAAIMTGKYGHVTGAIGWAPYDRRHRTFPEYLQAAGYQTALIGKYHLGDNPPGFDHFDILPGQGRYRDPVLVSKEGSRVCKGHVSDVITDLALAWLDRRDPQRPFLLCLHDKATHMPWQSAERFGALLANRVFPEPPTLLDNYAGRADVLRWTICRVSQLNRWQKSLWGEPPSGSTPEQETRWLYQQYLRHYLRTATGLDENIGRVLDYLDRHGLTGETVVVYASDQGFLLGEHGLFDKRWMYEECLRLPLVVRYPPLARAGSVSDALVLNIDFAPTLLDLAGLAVPADMQGRSLRPLLTARVPADWRKSVYYRYYAKEYGIPPQCGVRTERHKLIHYQGPIGTDFGPTGVKPGRWLDVDAWELFDLQQDPDELTDLYGRPESQATVVALKAELERLRKELGDTKD